MRDYNNIVVTINPTVQWKQTTISFSTKSQEKIFNWPDEHDPWFNCNSPWIDGWKYNYDKFLSGQISKINKSMIKNVFFYVNMVTFTYQYGTKIVIKNQWTDKIDLTNSFKNTGLSDNIYFSTNDWSKGGRPWADFGILDKKGNKILFAKSGTDIGSSETTAPNGGYFDINYNDFIY